MAQHRYRVIVSLSHHRIGYEYHLSGGSDELQAMPGGNWPEPLAFYSSPTGIIIGHEAYRAAMAHIAGAFIGYFEHLPQQLTYEIGGERRPFSNILIEASETLFRTFYQRTLLSSYGPLADNRANMPLTILCEADMPDNEIVFLYNSFRDSGYERVAVESYDRYIAEYVRQTMVAQYSGAKCFVAAWTEGTDMCFTLFSPVPDAKPVRAIYPGLGVDPRLPYVVERIWADLLGQDQWLEREREEGAMRRAATAFLNSDAPLVTDYIEASNGVSYRYSLNRRTIDFLECDQAHSLRAALRAFLKENGITSAADCVLLLRGNAADNRYFENNLAPGFAHVVRSDKALRAAVMRLVVSAPAAEAKPKAVPKAAPKAKPEPTPKPKAAPKAAPKAKPEPTPTPTPTPPPAPKAPTEPSADDKKALRTLRMEVGALVSKKQGTKALALIATFEKQMQAKDIAAFDDTLRALKEKVGPVEQPAPKAKTPKAPATKAKEQPATPAPTPPTRLDERNLRLLEHSIKARLKAGNARAARAELRAFATEVQGRGITAFDEKIKQLQKEIRTNQQSNK